MRTVTARNIETPVDEKGHFLPKRSNLWAVKLGFWFGRGYSPKAIADIMGEDTSEGTVKGQVCRADLLSDMYRGTVIPVEIYSWQRDAIAKKAAKLGVPMDVLIERVLLSTLVYDDLYDAVTDGRFDSKPLMFGKAA